MDTNKLIALLPDLATLVSVVDAGSFTDAAIQLGVTPSAISRQITRLESELGTKLLQRTTRSQSLTPAGLEAYQHCIAILENAKQVVDIAHRDAKEISGTIRLSVPKAFGKQILQRHLIRFVQTYPKVSLTTNVTDRHCDPISDDLDIVFAITDSPQQNLIAKTLGHVDSILCASPDYLREHGEPNYPTQLKQHSCLALSENSNDSNWMLSKQADTISIDVRGAFTINHSEMRRDAAIEGLGIALLPNYVAAEAILNGELQAILCDWTIKGPYQGAIVMQFMPSKHLPLKIRAFIDFMTQAFQR
jgi:DNA-binding transcriptional LysR family regulator